MYEFPNERVKRIMDEATNAREAENEKGRPIYREKLTVDINKAAELYGTTEDEIIRLMFDTSLGSADNWAGAAFTRRGILELANVLNTETAREVREFMARVKKARAQG